MAEVVLFLPFNLGKLPTFSPRSRLIPGNIPVREVTLRLTCSSLAPWRFLREAPSFHHLHGPPPSLVPLIREQLRIHAPAERCFDLTRSVDLHADSSPGIAARAVAGRCTGLSKNGDSTTWSARFFGLRFRMTTRIENFSRPLRFDDRLTHGLLRRFAHTYRFDALPDGTCILSDELTVSAPFPPLGYLVERLYLERRMCALVRHRLTAIKAVAEDDTLWPRYLSPAA